MKLLKLVIFLALIAPAMAKTVEMKTCPKCNGRGGFGVGGPGAVTFSTCTQCGGTKVVPK